MKTIFLLAFTVGSALALQPSLWSNLTCPDEGHIESRIVLGVDAPDGKYPYMLSMSYEKNNGHSCGASILTKRWALTAAHCCAILKQYKHYLKSGTNSLTQGGTIHQMEKYIIHENYTPSNSWINDVCLIRVSNPFVYGPKVQQITLPPMNWEVRDGDKVDITGWGYTKPNVQVAPDKLQLGKDFVAWSQSKCYSKTGKNHASYLCALGGQRGQGVCNGDSGSPLVKNGVQVGIASWVYQPCGCGMPDFYARVPIFIDWIKKQLGPEASELKFYK